MLKSLQGLSKRFWWITIPISAFSFVSITVSLLDNLGLNTEQWLDIVHSILIRWRFATGWLFSNIDMALHIITFNTNPIMRDAALLTCIIMTQRNWTQLSTKLWGRAALLAVISIILSLLLKTPEVFRYAATAMAYFTGTIMSIIELRTALRGPAPLQREARLLVGATTVFVCCMVLWWHNTVLLIALVMSVLWLAIVIAMYRFQPRRFKVLMFCAAAILSMELFRFAPLIQGNVDALQKWLENVPKTYD